MEIGWYNLLYIIRYAYLIEIWQYESLNLLSCSYLNFLIGFSLEMILFFSEIFESQQNVKTIVLLWIRVIAPIDLYCRWRCERTIMTAVIRIVGCKQGQATYEKKKQKISFVLFYENFFFANYGRLYFLYIWM